METAPDPLPQGPSAADVARALRKLARPSPWDRSHRPSRGEKKTFFTSDGVLYYGYMTGCFDYQPRPSLLRWQKKVGEYLELMMVSGRPEWRMDPWIKRSFWHDGKNPECTQDAENNGENLCGGAGVAMVLACGSVPACWTALTATPVGVGATLFTGSVLYDKCKNWVKGYAIQHICHP